MTIRDELSRLRLRDALTQRVMVASLKSPRIASAIRAAADKDKKKDKGAEEAELPDGDMELLVELRGKLNQKWEQSQKPSKGKPSKKAFAEGEGDEEAKAQASKQVSAMWLKFLEDVHEKGRERVKNTNPKTKDKNPEVSFSTLFKNDQGFRAKAIKEFKEWLRKGQEGEAPTEEKPSSEESLKEEETPSSSKETPSAFRTPGTKGIASVPTTTTKKLLKKASFMGDLSKKQQKKILARYKEALGTDDLNEILHAMGFSEIPGVEKLRLNIGMAEDKLTVFTFEGGLDCERVITFDENNVPSLYNDHLKLPEGSPKGTGTRIFASEIAWARKLGIKKISCSAHRDDDETPPYIGYKVWPRLGYDGDISKSLGRNELPPDLKECLGDQTNIQALFACGPKAIEWWDENGDSFDATFDTEGFSAELFDAYLEKKGGFDGLTQASK